MDQRNIAATGRLFVVQQHLASHLHFDLRLEVNGVLKSWAVPKGPSDNPKDKRFAALVEDHPVDYGDFEGQIPPGNYGAGSVIVWDRGWYTPLLDMAAGLESGKLLFELHGHKLRGRWTLVRMKRSGEPQPRDWLWIRERDGTGDPEPRPFDDRSIYSGLRVDQLVRAKSLRKRLQHQAGKLGTPIEPNTPRPKPMLASPGSAFDDPDWVYEYKYDGYRLAATKTSAQAAVELSSRNGQDLSAHFPELRASLRHLNADQFHIDGEVVLLDELGRPSFSLLQQRLRLRNERLIAQAAVCNPVQLMAFDLLQLGGFELQDLPLTTRKKLLQRLLPARGPVRYSEHVARYGKRVFASAQQLGLEGMVAKRADAPYRAGRQRSWVKVRTERSGDFVVLGWVPARGNPQDLGALALGEYRDGKLCFVGNVGSGFRQSDRQQLLARLQKTAEAAVDVPTKMPKTRWVEASQVVEVRYKELTRDGKLRQASFIRLREDKLAAECIGQGSLPLAPLPVTAEAPEVRITNADKVFFPEQQLSKGDLVQYYEAISAWMLPYLQDRPLVLTRYPDGIHGKSFYQRDAPEFVPEWIERCTLYSESGGREVSYFLVHTPAALKYLANLGTIALHFWHARTTSLAQPDWCVLDLDPKTAPFAHVVQLAKATHELCNELELPAFVKTSGASGLHVLVPLGQQLTHEQARTLGELLARVLCQRHGDIATIERKLSERAGKVYIDYLQNGHGQLLVAPFSARAEVAASVSMPIRWHELNGKLSNQRFNIKNAAKRMQRLKEDPMQQLLALTPDLLRALSRLQRLA